MCLNVSVICQNRKANSSNTQNWWEAANKTNISEQNQSICKRSKKSNRNASRVHRRFRNLFCHTQITVPCPCEWYCSSNVAANKIIIQNTSVSELIWFSVEIIEEVERCVIWWLVTYGSRTILSHTSSQFTHWGWFVQLIFVRLFVVGRLDFECLCLTGGCSFLIWNLTTGIKIRLDKNKREILICNNHESFGDEKWRQPKKTLRFLCLLI